MAVVDFDRLPPPAVVEPLDYERILASLVADYRLRWPQFSAALESEPAVKLMEVAAYRELLLRARVNDAARGVMLPLAAGTDLDHLAARYDVVRLPGEDDDRLRHRVLIGYHALSGAGSAAAWRLRALSVSADVRQVDAYAVAPGRVRVAVLARELAPRYTLREDDIQIGEALFGAGPDPTLCWRVATDQDALLTSVSMALQADDVRPLTVDVGVVAARVLPVDVIARLIHPPGPDAALLVSSAQARLAALAAQARFRIDITRSLLHAALVGEWVRDVLLESPAAPVAAGPGEIAVIRHVTLTAEARHD